MHFLNLFINKSLHYNLTNKFFYNNIKNLPKFKKIILTFNYESNDLKLFFSSILFLEIIINQKGFLTLTKNKKINITLKKGYSKNCKIILTNKRFIFLFSKFILVNKLKKFNCTFKNFFMFKNIESNYIIFNNLPVFKIQLILTNKKLLNLLFLRI